MGGHCIGVDPYYLTHRAEMAGYHPQVILAGRRINDGMAKFVADKTMRMISLAGKPVRGAKIVVLGLTFKENVSDLRNSKAADLCAELKGYGADVHVHDPIADAVEAQHEYGLILTPWEKLPRADALVVAVAHEAYVKKSVVDWCRMVQPQASIVDIKGVLDLGELRRNGFSCWRL